MQENSELKEKVKDAQEEHERECRQLKIVMDSVQEDLRREREVNSRAAMVSLGGRGSTARVPQGCQQAIMSLGAETIRGRGEVGVTVPTCTQEDYSKLQREHSELRAQEQRQTRHVKELEAEQQRQVAETMKLRNQLDQYRQDLTQYDSEKRTLSRQLTTNEVEQNQLRGRVKELEEQLAEVDKEKNKKA